MLVSFPSVSTSLNANAKEFVPSFSTSPPPSPPSQSDPSPVESSSPVSESAQPIFRHPPAVSPFPRFESAPPLAISSNVVAPRRQPRSPLNSSSHHGATRTSSSQFFAANPSYQKHSARGRHAYSHSRSGSSSSSRQQSLPRSSAAVPIGGTGASSSRAPPSTSHAATTTTTRPNLKNTVHSLLRSWHVREGTVGRLLVLRGLPGSGKSTTASLLSSHAIVCSVDRFFPPGENFDQKRMKDAFKACKQDFYTAVNNHHSLVILDNVNCERWQYDAEIDAARRLGYSVRIWEFQPQTKRDLWTCWERNHHGISQHQFMTFYRRWEADPKAQQIPILHSI